MDKLFEVYNIDEISQKTHISPMFLEKLKNKELDGIEKIKLKGFIKILKSEYPDFDFSELQEYLDNFQEEQEEIKEEVVKEEKDFKVYIIVIVLIIAIIGLVFYMNKTQKPNNIHIKEEAIIEVNQTKIVTENNQTIIKKETFKEIKKNNKIVKKEFNSTFIIIPKQQIWLKVYYLDTNKSKEFLTSHNIVLNFPKDSKEFIKLGHGLINIIYDNKEYNLTKPRVTRLFIHDGEFNITKKKVSEFK